MNIEKAQAGWTMMGEAMGWIQGDAPAVPLPDPAEVARLQAAVDTSRKTLSNQYHQLAKEEAAGSVPGSRWSTINRAKDTLEAAKAAYRAYTGAEPSGGDPMRQPVTEPEDPEPEPEPAPAAPAPTIKPSEVDPFRISVAAPAGAKIRVRPVGSNTDGVIFDDTNVRLPGSGAFEIAVADGPVWSTPTFYWAYKVGERGFFHGLDAKLVQTAQFSEGAQVIVVPVEGRKVTVFEPLPKMAVDGQGFWTNGVMKNGDASTGRGPQAFDNRAINTVQNGMSQYKMKGFDLGVAHTSWPEVLEVRDTVAKVVSRPELSKVGQDHRAGVIENLMGLVVMDKAPPTNVPTLAGKLFKGRTLSQDYVPLPKFNDLLARVQALRLPVSGTVPDVDAILAKITRGNWQYTLLRGGTHDDDAQEAFSPRLNGWPEGQGNYYQFTLHQAAMLLLATNAVSDEWKRKVLQALVYFGSHADYPGNGARMSAGIAQHHEAPVSLKRLAEGRGYEDMALPSSQGGQRGNFFGSYFKWTPEMLPMLDKHDRLDWPIFSRRRKVTSIVTTAGGKTHFMVEWRQNVSPGLGDKDRKQVFRGLEVVREATGEALPFDPAADNNTRPLNSTALMGVTGSFKTPLKVGEVIYMRIPARFKPFAGLADWMYASQERLDSNYWTYYNPTPTMNYRKINRPSGWILLMSALGEIDRNGPYAPVQEYFIRTALPETTPNNGWLSHYDGPHLPGAEFIGSFWREHAEALGLTL